MYVIRAIQDTWLKLNSADSIHLLRSQKGQFMEGSTLAVDSFHVTKDRHFKIWVQSDYLMSDGSRREGPFYVFTEHAQITTLKQEVNVKLPVPYFRQIDNDTTHHGAGSRQCNLTAHAMLVEYLLNGALSEAAKAKGFNEPESYYGQLLSKYGDTTLWSAQGQVLRELGIESEFRTNADELDLNEQLALGIPVVIGLLYKRSGHIALLVGRDSLNSVYWIHDPYGKRLGVTDQYDTRVSGAYDTYLFKTFRKLWNPKAEGGYARLITHVRGVPVPELKLNKRS